MASPHHFAWGGSSSIWCKRLQKQMRTYYSFQINLLPAPLARDPAPGVRDLSLVFCLYQMSRLETVVCTCWLRLAKPVLCVKIPKNVSHRADRGCVPWRVGHRPYNHKTTAQTHKNKKYHLLYFFLKERVMKAIIRWKLYWKAPFLFSGLGLIAVTLNKMSLVSSYQWIELISLVLFLEWILSLIYQPADFFPSCRVPVLRYSFSITTCKARPIMVNSLSYTHLPLSVLTRDRALLASTLAVVLVNGCLPIMMFQQSSIFTRHSLLVSHRVISGWFSYRWRR